MNRKLATGKRKTLATIFEVISKFKHFNQFKTQFAYSTKSFFTVKSRETMLVCFSYLSLQNNYCSAFFQLNLKMKLKKCNEKMYIYNTNVMK